jgi:hypothetical protein
VIWSVLEVDDDASHVICTDSVVSVLGKDVIEQVLNVDGDVLVSCVILFSILIYLFAAFFVTNAVPDSVTCQHDVLVLLCPVGRADVWEATHSLVLWLLTLLIFVLEITKGTTQS